MNRKQAIAYAKVTLNFMQSSKYNREINPKNLEIEMNETFKIYKTNIIQDIAKAQDCANIELEKIIKKDRKQLS